MHPFTPPAGSVSAAAATGRLDGRYHFLPSLDVPSGVICTSWVGIRVRARIRLRAGPVSCHARRTAT